MTVKVSKVDSAVVTSNNASALAVVKADAGVIKTVTTSRLAVAKVCCAVVVHMPPEFVVRSAIING
jgi:hypothetical protein